jgi:hypothetical protein
VAQRLLLDANPAELVNLDRCDVPLCCGSMAEYSPVRSDVSGLAWAQSPGLGLALVGLGFGNPEPGPNSGLAKARGLARAQARAYIPYMVIIADSFKTK